MSLYKSLLLGLTGRLGGGGTLLLGLNLYNDRFPWAFSSLLTPILLLAGFSFSFVLDPVFFSVPRIKNKMLDLNINQ